MADDEGEKNYAVGYKRPPKSKQFQKGRSGNPRGRPRGAKNLSTIVGEVANERVAATIDGKLKKISKLKLSITQMVNDAAKGNHRARQELMRLMLLVEATANTLPAQAPIPKEADNLVMENIVKRMREPENGSPALPGEATVDGK